MREAAKVHPKSPLVSSIGIIKLTTTGGAPKNAKMLFVQSLVSIDRSVQMAEHDNKPAP